VATRGSFCASSHAVSLLTMNRIVSYAVGTTWRRTHEVQGGHVQVRKKYFS